MAEKSTVFLLVRHLTSTGAHAREGFFDPSRNYAVIPQYKRIKDTVKSIKGQNLNIDEAKKIHSKLIESGDLKVVEDVLDRIGYAGLGPDKDLPLVPGESERGREIGSALKIYLNQTLGRGIDRAESSPFER
ncbi:MAG TPA: hypothetical protein VF189_00410, partial [Patescibacteria group bacterium]